MKKIAALVIIATAFLSACSSTRWIQTTVVKQRDFVVNLEQRQKEGNIIDRQYDHPFEIAPADLEKFMKDLAYVEKVGLMNTEKQNPVFQTVEIEQLAPVLADTLAKADASQRIRFISYNRGQALIFSVSRETEGVMFVDSGKRLNIAFNFINSEIDPTETRPYSPGLSKDDPLEIKFSDTTIIPVTAYADLHKFETGAPAPMWVVADLEKLNQAVSAAPVVTPQPETNTAVEPAAPAKVSESALQDDIKDKLTYLKELLDEGLISEKDYDAKKTELLDKIK